MDFEGETADARQYLGALASAAQPPHATQVLAADAAAMLGLAEVLARRSEADAQGRLAPLAMEYRGI